MIQQSVSSAAARLPGSATPITPTLRAFAAALAAELHSLQGEFANLEQCATCQPAEHTLAASAPPNSALRGSPVAEAAGGAAPSYGLLQLEAAAAVPMQRLLLLSQALQECAPPTTVSHAAGASSWVLNGLDRLLNRYALTTGPEGAAAACGCHRRAATGAPALLRHALAMLCIVVSPCGMDGTYVSKVQD